MEARQTQCLSLLGSISLVAVVLGGTSCVTRPVDEVGCKVSEVVPLPFLQSTDTELDLLFVIDNSVSMSHEQDNLARNFPRLIDALRSHELGPDGSGRPCNEQDVSGCQIPDLHIGVVSTDLGVGPNARIDGCNAEGDRGMLLHAARDATCTPPSEPFIRYKEGATNVPGASADAIEQVKQAFGCVAKLGTNGCGFEQQLEAARLALDGRNKGFLREDALLAVVLITDEDDCSARNRQLFEPGVLGDLNNFRCFQHGFSCNVNGTHVGPREDCQPSGDYLFAPERYVDFFRRLKPKGRLVFATISGPTGSTVTVGRDGKDPTVQPSCNSSNGLATPALRIQRVVDALGDDGHTSSICDGDFGQAMVAIGGELQGRIGSQCIGQILMTEEDKVACVAGDAFSADQTCGASSLEQASCVVIEGRGTELDKSGAQVPRCPSTLWYPKDWQAERSCGADCPCWRLVRKPQRCGPAAAASPYALDILRAGEAPKGTVAKISCRIVPGASWGSAQLKARGECAPAAP